MRRDRAGVRRVAGMSGTQPVVVAGVAMTAFRRGGRRVRDTVQEAVAAARADAGAGAEQVQSVAYANAVVGLVTGPEMVRAQPALRCTGCSAPRW